MYYMQYMIPLYAEKRLKGRIPLKGKSALKRQSRLKDQSEKIQEIFSKGS
jgi:hypothetical protein